MYPQQFLSLFPPFPIEPRVFVAMSFEQRFARRWEDVIQPAIQAVPLEPFRVDSSEVNDSILTEILDGIATSRLVFADISPLTSDIRNANVMYEVGIAHAARAPQEVILFRDDDRPLPFDVTNARVKRYDPDSDPEGARSSLTSALLGALSEIDLTRSKTVLALAAQLDRHGTATLLSVRRAGESFEGPPTSLSRWLDNVAFSKLLELQIFELDPVETGRAVDSAKEEGRSADPFPFRYRLTPLGSAVRGAVLLRLRSGLRAQE